MSFLEFNLIFGQHKENTLCVRRERSKHVCNTGELKASARFNHHAFSSSLVGVWEEGGCVEPDKVEPGQKTRLILSYHCY